MAVRSTLPWPLRWLLGALVLGFSGALALWAFEFGKEIAGLEQDTRGQLQRLRVEHQQVLAEMSELKSVANTADSLLLAERSAQEQLKQQLRTLEDAARDDYEAALRAQELRVFGYRLALTLPLLVAAGWLFKRHRHGASWPFVWGFIFFALFAFFVELVPYLPSYGGYVRYIVGIVLTVVGGRYAIQALQRYLERQKQVEALPDNQRRQGMDYDLAQARLVKNVCPGCERPVDLKDGKTDFCPHCGLCLFDHCGSCNTRKSAFARYCFACGTPAKGESASTEAPTPV